MVFRKHSCMGLLLLMAVAAKSVWASHGIEMDSVATRQLLQGTPEDENFLLSLRGMTKSKLTCGYIQNATKLWFAQTVRPAMLVALQLGDSPNNLRYLSNINISCTSISDSVYDHWVSFTLVNRQASAFMSVMADEEVKAGFTNAALSLMSCEDTIAVLRAPNNRTYPDIVFVCDTFGYEDTESTIYHSAPELCCQDDMESVLRADFVGGPQANEDVCTHLIAALNETFIAVLGSAQAGTVSSLGCVDVSSPIIRIEFNMTAKDRLAKVLDALASNADVRSALGSNLMSRGSCYLSTTFSAARDNTLPMITLSKLGTAGSPSHGFTSMNTAIAVPSMDCTPSDETSVSVLMVGMKVDCTGAEKSIQDAWTEAIPASSFKVQRCIILDEGASGVMLVIALARDQVSPLLYAFTSSTSWRKDMTSALRELYQPFTCGATGLLVNFPMLKVKGVAVGCSNESLAGIPSEETAVIVDTNLCCPA